MFSDKIIFIVGNSRSGTTMMLRIFNNHDQLMVLNELHFFEELWSPIDKGKSISRADAIFLMQKLLLIQRKGYKVGFDDFSIFYDEAKQVLDKFEDKDLIPENIFYQFAKREVALNGKSIVCEKTPQNVFYLKEIFELFPNAKVINMVRDPRGVMLSQKNKWNRRNLGGWYITKKEARRLRINYHPITLTTLWNAAINAVKKNEDDQRILTVIFEELVNQPEQEIKKICKHIDVSFNPEMMMITQESSSIEPDSEEKGFKKERVANWQKGGLNNTEIWFCEKIGIQNIQHYGYKFSNVQPNYLLVPLYLISFPIKLILSFMLNLDRMKNIFDTLKRRLS